MIELEYVVVGHVTHDLAGDGVLVGGTAAYAGLTAWAMGRRVGIVTSAGPDLARHALGDVLVSCRPAAATTTFENIETADGRRQVLHGVAETLAPETVPPDWSTPLVHLGPVAQECDPALAAAFGGVFMGVTPQGWMRSWDGDGRVSRAGWDGAEEWLARADAVVLSDEDVKGDENVIARYASLARLLVVTRGAAGCIIHTAGRQQSIPAPAVRQVDTTGAGDVFAAALFVQLERGASPRAAARFANCVAARSVTRRGLAGIPSAAEIARCEPLLSR